MQWLTADIILLNLNDINALFCALKVFREIKMSAAREIQPVMHLLNAGHMKPTDIYQQVCEVYGEYAISESTVQRSVRHFT